MSGMVEKRGLGIWLTHLGLIIGIAIICFPIYMAFVASTVTQPEIARPPMPLIPGPHLIENYTAALTRGVNSPVLLMLFNSSVMALGITIGKIVISIISAYAIVYFRFPFRMAFFWMIFLTLMLPVEVRIVPTYEVVAGFGMLNSYTGLILPLVATATGTFLYRQFFMTIPDELVEASKMDGSGPIRFFFDVLLPLSRTNMLALATIMFVSSWNQYLWPLLITTDRANYGTVVMQLKALIPAQNGTPDWNVTMAGALIIMLPPLLIVAFMQRWFVRGLITKDK